MRLTQPGVARCEVVDCLIPTSQVEPPLDHLPAHDEAIGVPGGALVQGDQGYDGVDRTQQRVEAAGLASAAGVDAGGRTVHIERGVDGEDHTPGRWSAASAVRRVWLGGGDQSEECGQQPEQSAGSVSVADGPVEDPVGHAGHTGSGPSSASRPPSTGCQRRLSPSALCSATVMACRESFPHGTLLVQPDLMLGRRVRIVVKPLCERQRRAWPSRPYAPNSASVALVGTR
jgi:hypothetical protein